MLRAAMNPLLYMDAVIRPNRSLSRRGFVILISLLTAINVITAIVFVSMGAAPVPIFLGMDLLAIFVAFVASFRAAERIERVQVSAEEVRVIRQWREREETVWISPTRDTQVRVDRQDPDEEIIKLRLFGREFAVAQSLSLTERAAFGRALDRAIWRARRGEAAA